MSLGEKNSESAGEIAKKLNKGMKVKKRGKSVCGRARKAHMKARTVCCQT